MRSECFPGLTLGALPDRSQLLRLLHCGTRDVVNVSGVDLQRIHGSRLPEALRITELGFPDLFSQARQDPEAWQRFGIDHGPRVIEAAQHVADLLMAGRAVHCCCHQGRSRSPLIAAAGLMRAFGLDSRRAIRIITDKQPLAEFTPRSIWMLQLLAEGTPSHAEWI